MKPQLIIINGPNLNLLGTRQPEVYGNRTFEEYYSELKNQFPQFSIDYFQSNIEGEIINKLHETGFSFAGIILNVGGYTHTSVAIADAIASIRTPVVEVHISNIYSREEFRQKSLLSSHCKGIVAGFGMQSYEFAIRSFLEQ